MVTINEWYLSRPVTPKYFNSESLPSWGKGVKTLVSVLSSLGRKTRRVLYTV